MKLDFSKDISYNGDMMDKRRAPRYASLAQARIEGISAGEALLRDLSVIGCRLEFSSAVAFEPGQVVRVLVVPEASATIEPFELEAESRWSRADYDAFEVGFSIRSSPKGKAFQRYVDYLAWRHAGNSAPAQA